MSRSILIIATLLFAACSKDSESPKITKFTESWYNVEEINSQTWIMQEGRSPQGNVSYLVSGSERAIMFDAGTGENFGQDGSRILYKIKETTDLPVTLLLSHFHFDHNQNIAEFENVAFPDLDFLRQSVDESNVYQFSKEDLFVGTSPASVQVGEWLPLETDIDLGDRLIQLVNLPGHTDESVIIIDHENKLAFLGDFLYSGEIYVFDPQNLQVYANSMEKLMTLINNEYVLYGAHGAPQVSYQHLLNSLSLLNCILNSDCFTESGTSVFGKSATRYHSKDGATTVLLVHTD